MERKLTITTGRRGLFSLRSGCMEFDYFQVYKRQIYDDSGVVPKPTGQFIYGIKTSILIESEVHTELINGFFETKLIWHKALKTAELDPTSGTIRKFPLVFHCHLFRNTSLVIQIEVHGRLHADFDHYQKWPDFGRVQVSRVEVLKQLSEIEDLLRVNGLKCAPTAVWFDGETVEPNFHLDRIFEYVD